MSGVNKRRVSSINAMSLWPLEMSQRSPAPQSSRMEDVINFFEQPVLPFGISCEQDKSE